MQQVYSAPPAPPTHLPIHCRAAAYHAAAAHRMLYRIAGFTFRAVSGWFATTLLPRYLCFRLPACLQYQRTLHLPHTRSAFRALASFGRTLPATFATAHRTAHASPRPDALPHYAIRLLTLPHTVRLTRMQHAARLWISYVPWDYLASHAPAYLASLERKKEGRDNVPSRFLDGRTGWTATARAAPARLRHTALHYTSTPSTALFARGQHATKRALLPTLRASALRGYRASPLRAFPASSVALLRKRITRAVKRRLALLHAQRLSPLFPPLPFSPSCPCSFLPALAGRAGGHPLLACPVWRRNMTPTFSCRALLLILLRRGRAGRGRGCETFTAPANAWQHHPHHTPAAGSGGRRTRLPFPRLQQSVLRLPPSIPLPPTPPSTPCLGMGWEGRLTHPHLRSTQRHPHPQPLPHHHPPPRLLAPAACPCPYHHSHTAPPPPPLPALPPCHTNGRLPTCTHMAPPAPSIPTPSPCLRTEEGESTIQTCDIRSATSISIRLEDHLSKHLLLTSHS